MATFTELTNKELGKLYRTLSTGQYRTWHKEGGMRAADLPVYDDSERLKREIDGELASRRWM